MPKYFKEVQSTLSELTIELFRFPCHVDIFSSLGMNTNSRSIEFSFMKKTLIYVETLQVLN